MERSNYIIRLHADEAKNEGKDLFSPISETLAEFMEMEADEVSNEIDQVYRIGNMFTKWNKLPREIHSKCVRKDFRDKVLQQARGKK